MTDKVSGVSPTNSESHEPAVPLGVLRRSFEAEIRDLESRASILRDLLEGDEERVGAIMDRAKDPSSDEAVALALGELVGAKAVLDAVTNDVIAHMDADPGAVRIAMDES